jgi:hypothetical protein
MANTTITPGPGILRLTTGLAPLLGLGSLALIGAAPGVILGTILAPSAGAIVVAGTLPIVPLKPLAGVLALSGIAPITRIGQSPYSGVALYQGCVPGVTVGYAALPPYLLPQAPASLFQPGAFIPAPTIAYYVPPAPLEDDELDNALQKWVVGITGLPPDLVRPRWQAIVPKQPEPGVDWCSIGVVSVHPEPNAFIQHLSGTITQASGDLSIRHEELEVLVSFLGPHAKKNLGILRDGFAVSLNFDAGKGWGLYFTGMDTGRLAPDFINQQWVRRWDSVITVRRMVARTYAVNNILSADIDLTDDTGHINRVIKVTPSSGH